MMRIRIDNMLSFSWKFLTPLAFVLLMATALMNAILRDTSSGIYIAGMLLTNVVIGWIVIEIVRRESRRSRARIQEPIHPAVVHP